MNPSDAAGGGGGGVAEITVTVSVPLMLSVVLPSGSVAVAVAVITAASGNVAGLRAVTIPPFRLVGSGATVNTVESELEKTRFAKIAFDARPWESKGETVNFTCWPGFKLTGI